MGFVVIEAPIKGIHMESAFQRSQDWDDFRLSTDCCSTIGRQIFGELFFNFSKHSDLVLDY